MRVLHLDIDELAALGAQCVIVPVRHRVEAASTIAKLDLGDKPGILQISEAVINGCKADARKHVFCPGKNFIRRQMPMRITDHTPEITNQIPDYGQHTREVLLAAGYSATELDSLAAAGVVRLAVQ